MIALCVLALVCANAFLAYETVFPSKPAPIAAPTPKLVARPIVQPKTAPIPLVSSSPVYRAPQTAAEMPPITKVSTPKRKKKKHRAPKAWFCESFLMCGGPWKIVYPI